MKLFLAFLIPCLCSLSPAPGHEQVDLGREASYSFKQHVYDLCSGHGLMHLNADEMRDLCEKLAANLDVVRELQEDPRHDIFLANLTGLIIRSPIPKDTKNNLLRNSYRIGKEKSSDGVEWHFTFLRLIEEGNVLSRDEISSHLSSQNRQLKGAATRFLEQAPENETNRPQRRTIGSDPEAKPSSPGIVTSEDIAQETGQTGVSRNWIIVVFAAGFLGILLLIWRNKISR